MNTNKNLNTSLREFLQTYQDEIVGVSINNYFYHVDYVNEINLEFDNEPILECYEIIYQNECLQTVQTQFTMGELLEAKQLEFYRFSPIKK